MKTALLIALMGWALSALAALAVEPPPGRADGSTLPPEQTTMFETVARDHFRYFQENQNPTTGLVLDRSNPDAPASIAAVGFALTAYPVAVERGWVTRQQAAAWTLKVLRHLASTPQGEDARTVSGYRGFFYHFLDPATGLRATAPKYWDSELSSIDTALLMAGVLFAQEYFQSDKEIHTLADALYKRVEWDWMADDAGLVYLQWSPEAKMDKHVWRGYSEGQLLYILALGSPTHPLKGGAWNAHIMHVQPQTHYDLRYIYTSGGPLFTYQYQQCWIDFRGIFDDKAREMGFDWFENASRATRAQHRYALENPGKWRGYGNLVWGQTACWGPGNFTKVIRGQERTFRQYSERGSPSGFDDGTIAPTAALSAIAHAPDIVIPTLEHWLKAYPELYTRQGFRDAFNPTLDESTATGWVYPESLGIDQGPIVLMIENYRSQFIWKTMRTCQVMRTGLQRAGFTGGWLSH